MRCGRRTFPLVERFVSVGIDSPDPPASARWWAAALDWSVVVAGADEAEIAPVGDDRLPTLVFLAVPEMKSVKNRIHLDIASDDADDQRRTVERLIAAGATPTDIGQHDVPWVVLADPDGNELCVLDPRDRYRGRGRLASVVVDAHDPAALGALLGGRDRVDDRIRGGRIRQPPSPEWPASRSRLRRSP